MTTPAGSGTLQFWCAFTSSLFKKPLGSFWKLDLQIPRMSVPGPPQTWLESDYSVPWWVLGFPLSWLINSLWCLWCVQKAAAEVHGGGLWSGSHFFLEGSNQGPAGILGAGCSDTPGARAQDDEAESWDLGPLLEAWGHRFPISDCVHFLSDCVLFWLHCLCFSSC